MHKKWLILFILSLLFSFSYSTIVNANSGDGAVEEWSSNYILLDTASSNIKLGERGDNATLGGYQNAYSANSSSVTFTIHGRFTVAAYADTASSPAFLKFSGITNCVASGLQTNKYCYDNLAAACTESSYVNQTGTISYDPSNSTVSGICTSGFQANDGIKVMQIPSAMRGFFKFDISSEINTNVKDAQICFQLESKTIDAGICEGTMQLIHINDFGTLDTGDWTYSSLGTVTTSFMTCSTTVGQVCTDIKTALQNDFDNSRTNSSFALVHSLEDDDGSDGYWTVTSGNSGSNKPFIDYTSVSIDINLLSIDGNPDNLGLPLFSDVKDGNLVMDFNALYEDNNSFLVDFNYNTSAARGGTVVFNDINILNTSVFTCDDYDFSNSTNCSFEWDISGIAIDNNYYAVLDFIDTGVTELEISDNDFMIDNTDPSTTWDGNGSIWQTFNSSIALTCDDGSGSGCNTTYYRVDSDASSTATIGNWTLYSSPIPFGTDGNWAIDYNSTDTVQNIEDTNRQYVLIDQNAPTIDSLSPSSTSTTTGTTATFSYTWADDGSGVVKCNFRIWNFDDNSLQIDSNVTSISFTPPNKYTCEKTIAIALGETFFAQGLAYDDVNKISGDSNTATMERTTVPVTPPAAAGGGGGGGTASVIEPVITPALITLEISSRVINVEKDRKKSLTLTIGNRTNQTLPLEITVEEPIVKYVHLIGDPIFSLEPNGISKVTFDIFAETELDYNALVAVGSIDSGILININIGQEIAKQEIKVGIGEPDLLSGLLTGTSFGFPNIGIFIFIAIAFYVTNLFRRKSELKN